MHILFLLACSTSTPETKPEPVAKPVAAKPKFDEAKLRKQATGLLGPLPKTAFTEARPEDVGRIALGRQLYFDPRLSSDNTISCNSCHKLDAYGADGEPTSPGVGGGRGGRNSPTVYNSALHMAQFWDGREPDVEAQAIGPILNPIEMAMGSEADVLAKIGAVPAYKKAFATVFDDGLTYTNIGVAIGAFERTLLTPAPFDAWLDGDAKALTDEQKLGFQTYVNVGCGTCHNGPLAGGNGYQKLGLVHPWDDDDMGRMDVTKDEADRQKFKVPSLRNIDKTGPYFHDGSEASLDEAIRKMAYHQLGKELETEEIASLKSFLGSLTGTIDAEKTKPPELPK